MPGMDTTIFSQGIAVGVLIWFMFRLEGILKEVSRQTRINTAATLLLVTNNPEATGAVKREAEALAKESERAPNGKT